MKGCSMIATVLDHGAIDVKCLDNPLCEATYLFDDLLHEEPKASSLNARSPTL